MIRSTDLNLGLGVNLLVLAVGNLAVDIVVVGVSTSETRVVLGSAGNLTGELLESLALGLWDEESGEDTHEHEESEDLHDVVEPWTWVGGGDDTTDTQRSDGSLGDDSADLARGSRNTVRGGTITGWETFSWNNECGGVWTLK